jgi:hypothetical protein
MVQKQVQFSRSLSAAKASPVIYLKAQIDIRRIQANQINFESELPLYENDLILAAFQEFQKDKRVEFPGTMLVGIRKGGMTGGTDTQVLEFAFAASEMT